MADFDIGHSNQIHSFAPANLFVLPNPRKRTWLWLGAGGGGLLLCAIALVVGSLVIYTRNESGERVLANNSGPTAAPQHTATSLSPLTAPPVIAPTLKASTVSQVSTARPTQTGGPTATAAPKFGPICFKPVTTSGPTLACDTSFPQAVVEVHVIFDYSGMVAGRSEWTRIWYHNGQEVLRVREKWNGDAAGQFDYNLNTTDGQPLSAGTWELELYANGVLQTYGAFVITPLGAPAGTATQTTAPPTPTPSPLPQFKLAYTRWNGSIHSIWVANLDGSDQRFLLDFAASPAWSPDGNWLAFFGEEGIDTQPAVAGGTNGIWIMSAEGQQPTRLLPEGTAQSVTWSPDGRLIAFDAARGGPDRRIYFIDPAGSPQPFETLGQQPSFSPDGKQVVAQVCRPNCGLWLQNLDDTAPHQLTTGGSDGLPAWSPDGSKIAFSRNVDDNVDIYIIDADGTGLRQLTTAPGIDSVPAWTPDGRQIAFRTTRSGLWQIFVMDAGGANQHLIIDNVGASNQWAFDRMSIK